MTTLLRLVIAGLALGLASPHARAQSTDGFHEIIVVPVAVDTASFVQTFTFRSASAAPIEIAPIYLPAEGTSQPGLLQCPHFTITQGNAISMTLRGLCAGLLYPGSQFGFIVFQRAGANHGAFAVSSRVSNPAEAGFAVEGFPAHTFTGALSSVAGVARRAATDYAPALQTNCFVGVMPQVDGFSTTQTKVVMGLLDRFGGQLGQPVVRDLSQGQFVRLLDVFSAMDIPQGDFDRVTFLVRPVTQNVPPEQALPGLVSFCTVQDNTSYSADFRIAKQETGLWADGTTLLSHAAQDGHVLRETLAFEDVAVSGLSGRPYTITPGASQQNDHVMYFRNPDWISCELVDAASKLRLAPEAGLEMRLLSLDDGNDGARVLAGGSGVTAWDRLYLGDKQDRRNGANARYLVQVEDGEGASLPMVSYGLHCRSGSGHTPGDVIDYHRSANDF